MTIKSEYRKAVPEDIREEARSWLTLFHCEETNEGDQRLFSEWLNSSEMHAIAFAEAERLWNELPFASEVLKDPTGNVVSLKRSNANAVSSFFNRRGAMAAIAASILVVIGITLISQRSAVSTKVYQTAIAEIKDVMLADGTKVTLNADSRLEVSIFDKSREVKLRGGAFFDVARDEGRLFRVAVAGTEVRVLGTAFEVWEGPRTVRVSVTRGKVQVTEEPNEMASIREGEVNPSSVMLTAGNQVVTSLNGQAGKIQSFDSESTLAWRKGHLIYIDAPLEDIVADVNRYRKKKIYITDAALAAMRITTAFKVDQTDKMLAGVMASHALMIEEKKSGIYIQPKN
ncbi:FecR family protein [Paremcibacter congregatus]|uniref:FecR protein domain-containing protein n=1 Tax=Paremcibacter congregatus TaxID=2043170 RepID=A0A2G4YR25_9PROT|nr:FecR domain-containing protein [Paremcibacter congregatus]PHZ84781.1 hypothetical protein CRD36_10140 [Paremcibacter congregatus]QDE26234.1 DUF4880 domain-containing protein [Paremcibacter congregatus]